MAAAAPVATLVANSGRAAAAAAADNLPLSLGFAASLSFNQIGDCCVLGNSSILEHQQQQLRWAGRQAVGSNGTDTVPTPKVIIDQDSDPDATVVEITFGDRLGALLDTMNALKNLGLNVVKANVFLDASGKHNTFSITKASTGRKVDDPELLEAIRLTIINNLLEYHPESSSQLAMGAAFGVEPPKEKLDVDISTHITISDDSAERSLLYVESADRPGLLVDLVKIISDINIAVESGEFDTEGLLAKAKFHVSYKGKAIIKPLQQVLSNSLRYFLRRPTTEDASF
ncbi:ACT domain-containing protein ACR11 [Linum perenne]